MLQVLTLPAKAGIAQFWESHILGREKEYCQIEKLANLDQLAAPFGFTVMAFPVNLRGTSAAWSRVVAMFEEPLAYSSPEAITAQLNEIEDVPREDAVAR